MLRCAVTKKKLRNQYLQSILRIYLMLLKRYNFILTCIVLFSIRIAANIQCLISTILINRGKVEKRPIIITYRYSY